MIAAMCHLDWAFDWANYAATATAGHGTYHILRTDPGHWTTSFRHAGMTATSDRPRPLPVGALAFASLADAVHACHRHAERYTTHATAGLRYLTPPPEG
jgi:hypothetical protein